MSFSRPPPLSITPLNAHSVACPPILHQCCRSLGQRRRRRVPPPSLLFFCMQGVSCSSHILATLTLRFPQSSLSFRSIQRICITSYQRKIFHLRRNILLVLCMQSKNAHSFGASSFSPAHQFDGPQGRINGERFSMSIKYC